MTNQSIRVLVGCGSAKRFDDVIDDCKDQLDHHIDTTGSTELIIEQATELVDTVDGIAEAEPDVDPHEFDELHGVVDKLTQTWNKKVPAATLYTSTYFDLKAEYATTFSDDWYIISAEHHVLHPDEEISTYEKSVTNMSRDERQAWGEETTTQLEQLNWDNIDTLVVLLGSAYLDPIRPVLDSLDVNLIFPFNDTGGIGEQMGVLKEAITADEHHPDAFPNDQASLVEFTS